MGYCMRQADSDFRIDCDNIPKAMEALRALAVKTEDMSRFTSFGNQRINHFSWVDMSFPEKNSLKDMVQCWRWHLVIGADGDVVAIKFEGEKLGDDEVLFQALAAFVSKDEFIEMFGEDGDRWRWTFNGKTVENKRAVVSWE